MGSHSVLICFCNVFILGVFRKTTHTCRLDDSPVLLFSELVIVIDCVGGVVIELIAAVRIRAEVMLDLPVDRFANATRLRLTVGYDSVSL